MKHLLIISSVFILLFLGGPAVVKAQLITDSDKKLKTEKKEKKGGFFGIFKKQNKKSSSGSEQHTSRFKGTRSASGSPFAAFNKRKDASPRYSQADRKALFRSKSTTPRYSSSGGLSFFNQKSRVTPRYSPASPYSGNRQNLLSNIFSPDQGPRYTPAGSPFSKKQRQVTPRYSPGSPFNQFSFANLFSFDSGPRYSQSSPFSKNRKKVTPRYSPGSPYMGNRQNLISNIFSPYQGPRYTPAGSPFSKKQRQVTPRYSPGSPFNQFSFANLFSIDSGPRYSQGSPFSKDQKKITPRYSPDPPYMGNRQNLISNIFSPDQGPRYTPAGSPFSKKQRQVTPRYSPGSPFNQSSFLSLFSINRGPRYSPGSPFDKSGLSIFSSEKGPRYSPGSPFDGVRWNIKPLYSTNKHRFDVNERMKQQSRIDNTATSRYKGTYKKDTKWLAQISNLMESQVTANFEGVRVPYRGDKFYKSKSGQMAAYEGNYKEKWLNKRKMHPSVAHNKANYSQEWIRESLRKWNIFLARVNRNKVQPDAVTDSVLKPKFDRKEAKIWYE